MDPEIFALAERVGERLRERKLSVAVAESSTGGLLGAALTDVPGSSAYFLGGVIAYANSVKTHQLGVPEETLVKDGAVSSATSAAMAEGVRRLLGADIGLSITGVAGPRADEHKPAGSTYIGLSIQETTSHHFQWPSSDRWDNRRRSVIAALELLARALEFMP